MTIAHFVKGPEITYVINYGHMHLHTYTYICLSDRVYPLALLALHCLNVHAYIFNCVSHYKKLIYIRTNMSL